VTVTALVASAYAVSCIFIRMILVAQVKRLFGGHFSRRSYLSFSLTIEDSGLGVKPEFWAFT
jgi:hypothetical protein